METYTDIGGLEKQIEELVEAIVEQADKFKTIGTKPKGCLMHSSSPRSIQSTDWMQLVQNDSIRRRAAIGLTSLMVSAMRGTSHGAVCRYPISLTQGMGNTKTRGKIHYLKIVPRIP